ncbi:MAG: dgoA protein, partial [Planctomycetaceae bacterium]
MLASRRGFLTAAGSLALAPSLTSASRAALRIAGAVASEQHFEITRVERTTVKLEFREVPRRNMDREIPHWRYAEVIDVTLKCGVRGSGETLLFYTWGVPSDESIQRVVGRSALELLWDD